MTTYLRYFRDLTRGIKFLQSTAGERLLASFILPFDGLGDAARGGFFAALPGHPEQHESSADQCGLERKLIKFGDESPEVWAAYVQNVWDTYEHFTTYQGVLAAVERWGAATFPNDWDPDVTTLTEDSFATFTITLPATLPAFDVPATFGTSITYGDDSIYGSSGSSRVFGLLKAAVRQAKPARSRGKIVLPYSTLPWSGTLLRNTLGTPDVDVSGESEFGRRVGVEITSNGSRGVATFDWTLYGVAEAVLDGGSATTGASVALGATGITLHFALGTYNTSYTYTTVEGFNVVTRLVINV